MYCPQCRSEFLSSATTCPDCNLPLVAELPPEPSHQAPEVRCVLETSDPDVLMVVASVLRAAGIPYWTPGESTMDLWPLGSGGGVAPSNLISTGVLVPADRYEEARALLDTKAQVVEPSPEQDSVGEVEEDAESEDER